MTRQKWTISALAVELCKDRRLIGSAVRDIDPVGKKGRSNLYWLSDVVTSLLDRDDLDLTAERARLAKAQADKVELEVAQRRGDLLAREDVADVWGVQIANSRAKLLAIGHSVAPQVAVEMETPDCQEIIDVRVREALGELRDFVSSDYRDGKRGGGSKGR